jgi:hypothetical protein
VQVRFLNASLKSCGLAAGHLPPKKSMPLDLTKEVVNMATAFFGLVLIVLLEERFLPGINVG